MLTKLFKKKPQEAVEEPVKLITHVIPGEVEKARHELLRAVNHDVTLFAMIEPILDNLQDIAWGFPASKENHHTSYTGLIEHSLSVAVKMAVAFKGSGKVAILHAVIAGLGHDLGKTTEWIVDTGGWRYNPFLNSLLTFQHPFSLVTQKPGYGYRESTRMSAALTIKRLLPDAYYKSNMCDVEELSLALEAIELHHAVPEDTKNRYLAVLDAADADDVKAGQEAISVAKTGLSVDKATIKAFKKGFLALSGNKTLLYGTDYCYLASDAGPNLALHISTFFMKHERSASIVEYMNKKLAVDVSQNRMLEILAIEGISHERARGVMAIDGKETAEAEWVFFSAGWFIDPPPADRYPNAYRTFKAGVAVQTPQALCEKEDGNSVDNDNAGEPEMEIEETEGY